MTGYIFNGLLSPKGGEGEDYTDYLKTNCFSILA